jgi:hypothetical protein
MAYSKQTAEKIAKFFDFQQNYLDELTNEEQSVTVSFFRTCVADLTSRSRRDYHEICVDLDLTPFPNQRAIYATGSIIDPNWREIAKAASDNGDIDLAHKITNFIDNNLQTYRTIATQKGKNASPFKMIASLKNTG